MYRQIVYHLETTRGWTLMKTTSIGSWWQYKGLPPIIVPNKEGYHFDITEEIYKRERRGFAKGYTGLTT